MQTTAEPKADFVNPAVDSGKPITATPSELIAKLIEKNPDLTTDQKLAFVDELRKHTDANADRLHMPMPGSRFMFSIVTRDFTPEFAAAWRTALFDKMLKARIWFDGMGERAPITVHGLNDVTGAEETFRIPRKEAERILGRKLEVGPGGEFVMLPHEFKTFEAAASVRRILLENPKLTYDDKCKILEKVRRYFDAKGQRRTTEAEFGQAVAQEIFAVLGEDTDNATRSQLALAELDAMMARPLQLQRPDGSAFHKIKEACHAMAICVPSVDRYQPQAERVPYQNLLDTEHHCFLIEHDWAAAFAGAGEFDSGEVHLPFPFTMFEFRVNGVRAALTLCQRDPEQGDHHTSAILLLELARRWTLIWYYEYENGKLIPTVRSKRAQDFVHDGFVGQVQPLADLIAKNIRAVCISLEAEVAETTVVRAPHKLNAAREKRGKLPIADYHVVSLAHRQRAPSLPRDPNAEPGTRKRLHFRRGHWRHYQNHKVWIRWMLVGSPDLGFVDKHYRL